MGIPLICAISVLIKSKNEISFNLPLKQEDSCGYEKAVILSIRMNLMKISTKIYTHTKL
jgi:hypothetical protein